MYYLEKIKLPRLIEVDDYHAFNDIESVLKKMNSRLRCVELSFNGAYYVGLIYAGRKPGKIKLLKLAAEQRIELA